MSKASGVPDPDTGDVSLRRITKDGTRAFLQTTQNLTADDADNGTWDDVYEWSGGVLQLLSKPTGVADPNSANSVFTDVSADGRRVLFGTNQKLTADDTDSNRNDLYVRTAAATTLVSRSPGVPNPDSGDAGSGAIAPDGGRVAFDSNEALTSGDTDGGFFDAYLATLANPAPQTAITGGPGVRTFDRTPTFTFASNETGSTFACRLDAGPFLPCASPRTLGPLALGSHTFRVRATDVEDAMDATAAVRTFTVAPRTLFIGSNAADNLVGTSRNEKACGRGGNDTIDMRGGSDVLYGGACGKRKPPALRTAAADGNDKLSGGGGNDFLDGGGGRDTVKGGAGNDIVSARDGAKDTVDCGKGKNDSATVDKADTVSGCEHVTRKP